MTWPGLTHCSECGGDLGGYIGLCYSCHQKREKERQDYELKELVNKMVAKELVKREHKIETLNLNINGESKILEGYWKDSIFNVIED